MATGKQLGQLADVIMLLNKEKCEQLEKLLVTTKQILDSEMSQPITFEERLTRFPQLWRYSLLAITINNRANWYPPEYFEALVMIGYPQLAIKTIESWEETNKQVEMFIRLARCLQKFPHYDKLAKTCLQIAFDTTQTHICSFSDIPPTVHCELALLLHQHHFRQEAFILLDQVEELSKTAEGDYWVYPKLALALTHIKEFQKAQQVLQSLIDFFPEHKEKRAEWVNSIAVAAIKAGNPSWALELIPQAKKFWLDFVNSTENSSVENALIWAELARTHLDLGLKTEALELFQQAKRAIDETLDSSEKTATAERIAEIWNSDVSEPNLDSELEELTAHLNSVSLQINPFAETQAINSLFVNFVRAEEFNCKKKSKRKFAGQIRWEDGLKVMGQAFLDAQAYIPDQFLVNLRGSLIDSTEIERVFVDTFIEGLLAKGAYNRVENFASKTPLISCKIQTFRKLFSYRKQDIEQELEKFEMVIPDNQIEYGNYHRLISKRGNLVAKLIAVGLLEKASEIGQLIGNLRERNTMLAAIAVEYAQQKNWIKALEIIPVFDPEDSWYYFKKPLYQIFQAMTLGGEWQAALNISMKLGGLENSIELFCLLQNELIANAPKTQLIQTVFDLATKYSAEINHWVIFNRVKLAWFLLELGAKHKVRDILEEITPVLPKKRGIHYTEECLQVAKLWTAIGQPNKAEIVLQNLYNIFRNARTTRSTYFLKLAEGFASCGLRNKALQVSQYAEKLPQFPSMLVESQIHRIYLWQRLGETQKILPASYTAFENLNQLLKGHPAYTNLLDKLVRVLLNAKQDEVALKIIEQACLKAETVEQLSECLKSFSAFLAIKPELAKLLLASFDWVKQELSMIIES